jgi:co-chaperonin GroES (HSP10)
MNLEPVGSRLVVQYKKPEPKKGALILPNEEQPQFATVIRLGSTCDIIGLSLGDLVALNRGAGVPFKIEGEIYIVVEEKDIIATMESENET